MTTSDNDEQPPDDGRKVFGVEIVLPGKPPFHIDVDALTKGSVIPRSVVEEMIGIRLEDDPDQFRWGILGLKSYIHAFNKDIDRVWSIRESHGALHIHTDAEAHLYEMSRIKKTRTIGRRCFRTMAAIDVAQLDEKQRATLEGDLVREARILQAMKAAMRIESTTKKAIASDSQTQQDG